MNRTHSGSITRHPTTKGGGCVIILLTPTTSEKFIYVPTDVDDAGLGVDMVFRNRIFLLFILGVISIISITLVASESANAHDGTHRIEWVYQGEDITSPSEPVASPGAIRPRRSFNPYEKNSIDITIELKNYGDGGDNISMDAYSPDPRLFVSVTPRFTYMAEDQTKFIKVTIEVPEDLHPGVYSLFVNASSEDPEFVTRVAPLDFEVSNYDAKVPTYPTMVDPQAGDFVRSEFPYPRGSNVSFKLKVENNGTRPLPGVVVRAFDTYMMDGIPVTWNFFNFTTPPIAVGDRFIVGDRPYTPTNPPLYWLANVPGDHSLMFRIFFEHQSVTDNDISMVNINVTAPPEIINIEPSTGATFKVGEEITFRVNAMDRNGDELTYTWNEGDEILGSEPEFNLSGLAPGEHTITLVVSDGIYTTRQTITITIEKQEKPDEPGLLATGALFALMMIAVITGRSRRNN